MRLCALTLKGIDFSSPATYRLSVKKVLEKAKPDLAVLPAFGALKLALASGFFSAPAPATFPDLLKKVRLLAGTFSDDFLDLHASLARELGIYLVPGTYFEKSSGAVYHSSCCFDPGGNVLALQRQTYLSQEEKEAGFLRGSELAIFNVAGFKTGLLITNDIRHPETGRLLALEGANLVLGLTALKAGANCFAQTAGLWAQTQQNQFWALEAPLNTTLAKRSFAASPAVYGPCEITPGESGFVARGNPLDAFLAAEINEEARLDLVRRYPLLKLLHPAAYNALKEQR